MDAEYCKMEYCPLLDGYCYTPGECDFCSIYDEYIEKYIKEIEKDEK